MTGGATIRAPTIGDVPQLWHDHERIFGYGVAVLAGFFLTAVQSWTGAPAGACGYRARCMRQFFLRWCLVSRRSRKEYRMRFLPGFS